VNRGRPSSVSTGVTPRPWSRPLLAVLFATFLVVGVAACGDDDTTTNDASGTTAAAGGSSGDDYYGDTTSGGSDTAAAEGTIVAMDYSLTDITVAPGDPIVLENDGDHTHTATADNGEFDLGRVDPGNTSDPGTAPTEPGTYGFHCEIHDTMTATLTVEG
jgi:plastocyanin